MLTTDTNDDLIMQILNLITTIPSIIGSFIMSYFCFRSMSIDASVKLILLLGISDFFYSIANLMAILGSDEDSVACRAEGVLRYLFRDLSICIATSIALFHRQAAKMFPNFKKTRFLVIATVVSLIISCLSSFSPLYAPEVFMFKKIGVMCVTYIRSESFNARLVYLLIFQTSFTFIGTIISAVCYISTSIMIRNVQERLVQSGQITTMSLLWYPITIFISFLPAHIYLFIQLWANIESDFWEGAIMLVTHSVGLTNALIYGYQRKLHKSTFLNETASAVEPDSEPGISVEAISKRLE